MLNYTAVPSLASSFTELEAASKQKGADSLFHVGGG